MAKKAKKTKAKAKAKAKAKKNKTAKPAKTTVKRQIGKSGPQPAANDAGLGIVSVEATANLMPPNPSFRVHARIEAPTPGFTAFLTKAVPQGINPAILILDVVLAKRPGTVIQVVTEIDADYEDKNYKGRYRQVTVRYGKVSKTAKVEIVA